jgi:hypothetical protein
MVQQVGLAGAVAAVAGVEASTVRGRRAVITDSDIYLIERTPGLVAATAWLSLRSHGLRNLTFT